MVGRPKEIPQDVWDKAFHEMDCHCPAVMFGDDELQPSVHAAIAHAIMAAKAEEREACAVIAADFEGLKRLLPYMSHQENEAAQVGQEFAGDEIAMLIRSRAALRNHEEGQ